MNHFTLATDTHRSPSNKMSIYRASCNCGCGGASGGPCLAMQQTAAEEKRHMQGLNDKLAGYIQRMREMAAKSGGNIDPAAYHESIRIMETEIDKLKNTYDSEIGRLRRLLDDCQREKGTLLADIEANRKMAADMQSRLSMEAGNGQRAADELGSLQRALAQREKDFADLKALLATLQGEADRLRPDNAKMAKEIDDLNRRLKGEMEMRLQAESQSKSLYDKSNFDSSARDQELRDLRDRLKASQDIIITLEQKIRQLSQGDGTNVSALLQKLRDGTASELRRYQQETENALNQSLGALKSQMDEDARMREVLGREKDQLLAELQGLRARVSDLEGQLAAAQQNKGNLEHALNSERSKAQSQVKDLDQRLRGMQESMMARMKECNVARDMQVSLTTEIDAYKTLLDDEDSRLRNNNINTSYHTSAIPVTSFKPLQPTRTAFSQPLSTKTTYTASYTNHNGTSTGPHGGGMTTRDKRVTFDYNPNTYAGGSFPNIGSSNVRNSFGSMYTKTTNGSLGAYRANNRPHTAWGYY